MFDVKQRFFYDPQLINIGVAMLKRTYCATNEERDLTSIVKDALELYFCVMDQVEQTKATNG